MIRAITLAGLLGLTLCVAGCGVDTPKCQASNCSGCCSSSGQCLGAAKQGATQCGAVGNVCKACLPGEMCSSGACVVDPDGGLADPDGGVCGVQGGACCANSVCQGTLVCSRNQCQVNTTTNDAGTSCGAQGQACCAGGFCLSPYTCASGTNTCTMAAPVDAGPTCGAQGQTCCSGSFCLYPFSCASASNTCVTAAPIDAGTPDAGAMRALGEPCTLSGDCASGLCQQLGFSGGYCTKNCGSQADCPGGSECSANPTGGAKVCLKDCSVPAGVGAAGGCRSGYVCDKANTSLDGLPVCTPACASLTTCGAARACDSRGLCCGNVGFACCEGATCGDGSTCSGGYCVPSGAGGGGGGGAAGGGSGGGGAGGGSGGGSATPGFGDLGGACNVGNDCLNGSPPVCLVQTGQNFINGYCTEDCTSASCAAGLTCAEYLAGKGTHYCGLDCTFDGGAGGCRAGYVCERMLATTNMLQGLCYSQAVDQGWCNTNAANTTYMAPGFCCGRPGYRCCPGNTCASGTCSVNGNGSTIAPGYCY
jgi:uncharacterized membrane protein YgcG